MGIIAITGGKGGTGKSTVATALAYALSKQGKTLLVDADVDCPDDHLLLGIPREHLAVVTQRIPSIDQKLCSRCAKCGKACRTKAIIAVPGKDPLFVESQCNGCGACRIVCPEGAISWKDKVIGDIYHGRAGGLDFLQGELRTGQPVSEFVVNSLMGEIGKRSGYEHIVIDTAAGTHCPVIAALEGADRVVAVTEPTPLGAHDLDIILQLLKMLGKPASIIINRSDLGEKRLITELAEKHQAQVVFEIAFSTTIVEHYSRGEPVQVPGLLSILT